VRILAVDISGLFSQKWLVDNGRGQDYNQPRLSTLHAVRKFREGHDRVAICCDSGKSFRTQLWDTYKADREDRGEPYRAQLGQTLEALSQDGCSVFRAPKYEGDLYAEADDVIGSLCQWAYESGHEVTILSADKDLMQLVGDEVKQISPLEKDPVVYGPEEVKAKLGVLPPLVPHLLALAGDSSDNYKPYPRVGPKLAATLLEKYRHATAVFAEPVDMAVLTQILGPKLADAVVGAGPEPARKALRVATIVRDLPLDFERLTGEPVIQRIEIESEPQPTPEPAQVAPMVSIVPAPKPVQMTAKSDPWALQPSGQNSLRAFAADVASSRMFPQIATAEQAIVVIAWGQNLGVPAMIALTQAYVVHGRVGWGAQFIAGLIKNNPSCEKFYVSETDDKHATVVYRRKGEPEGRYSFTIERAQKMGLIKPGGPWDKIPATMCRWACTRECARMVWPDVVTGVYTPDEIAQGELPEEMIATMVSRG